jgi:hypothetical protein
VIQESEGREPLGIKGTDLIAGKLATGDLLNGLRRNQRKRWARPGSL